MSSTNPRHHAWTPAQDDALLSMAAERIPVAARAKYFGLTERAVQFRLTTLRKRGASRSGNAGTLDRVSRVVIPARETHDTEPAPPLIDDSFDIPVTFEEPALPCDRVESVREDASSGAQTSESTRSDEWSVGRASRERVLERDLAEARRQNKALLDELQGRDAQLDVARALRGVTTPILATARKPGSKRHGTPVMLISDLHIEEPVDPAKVNGLNEYNLEIADACIARMADAYEWMLRDSRFDCREGVVWLGGDLFSGFIHEELMEANLLSPVEAMVWLQQRFIGFFLRVLKETQLERIRVVCNDGNHGRLTHKMRVQTRTENSLEWLLYQQLARHFASEPRLEFQIAPGVSNYLKIYDSTFCFQHGDTFNYGGGVGGLLVPVRRGANELRKYRHFDHLVIGHFHQRSDMNDIIVNGSGIGITPYGIKIKATPEPRQQSWFIVDQERGKCMSAPVWLPQTAS